jgi:cytochrome P450
LLINKIDTNDICEYSLAGTDTIAMTLSGKCLSIAVLTYICNFHPIYRALHFLIENLIYADRLLEETRVVYPDPSTRISHCDIASLRYLDAVLHEALRFRPPLTHSIPRVIPPEGAHSTSISYQVE